VVTKAVLFPVRFMYTLGAGRIGLNDGSVAWYVAQGLPGGVLALKALEWRNNGITDVELAMQLLDAELGALHAECLAAYAQELERLGDLSSASALADRAASVQVALPDPS
jgi:hypothetical protein